MAKLESYKKECVGTSPFINNPLRCVHLYSLYFIASKMDPTPFSWILLSLLLLLLTLIFPFIKARWNRRRRLPPGPSFALPLFGNILQLRNKPLQRLQKWRKLYGPIFSFKVGLLDVVMVSDAKLLKDLFAQEATTGRLQTNISGIHGNGKGIITSEGRNWAEQRAFAFKTLKGLTKGGTLESILLEEGQRLVRYFQQRLDTPVNMNGVFNGAILNIIWRLISGENHDWVENPELAHLNLPMEFAEAFNRTVRSGLMIIPGMRHVLPVTSGFSEYVKASARSTKMTEDIVNKHASSASTSTTKHDFIGEYLSHAEGMTDPHSSFFQHVGIKNLIVTLGDLFIAGTETTSTTLEFAILYISLHPEVQAELQKELDSMIGSRLPSQSDKLPYTEAVILETLRRSSIAPVALPHSTREDMEFHGYSIPKGTILAGDLHGIHMNPEVWLEPTAFRPERFLNEDKTKVVRHEALIPFSVGKRLCIGEGMARGTLFLVVACLMQRFTVEPVVPSMELDDFVLGFTLKLKPFKVVFKLRK